MIVLCFVGFTNVCVGCGGSEEVPAPYMQYPDGGGCLVWYGMVWYGVAW